MMGIDELLKKVPQSVKDKFLMQKRERAIELVKEDLKKNNKSVNDYDHDEIEGLIGDAFTRDSNAGSSLLKLNTIEGRLISRVQLFEDLLLKVQKRRRKGGKK